MPTRPEANPFGRRGVRGKMPARDRGISCHGQERVEKCEKAWDIMVGALQKQLVEERM